MGKKQILGIAYVSVWVIIWGTIGSLIDYPLLQANIYSAGTFGQYITFSIVAFLSILSAIFLFEKIMVKETKN